MSRTLPLLIALFLVLARPALAGGRLPDPERGDRTATWVALSGGITAGAGVLTLGLGLPLVVEGPAHTPHGAYGIGVALYGSGYVALAGCGGMMAGGALAARRVLVRRAGLRIPAWPGALALAAWGGTLAFAVAIPAIADVRPPGWLPLTTFVATHALGTVQLFMNRKAYRSLPDGLAPAKLAVRLTPQVGRHGAGVALQGTF